MSMPVISSLRSETPDLYERFRLIGAGGRPMAGLSFYLTCVSLPKFLAHALCVLSLTAPALAAELAPKGAYVSTDLSCAQFNSGDGNSMSLVEVDGLRFSSGKAYCDMKPTTKPNVYRAVCRAFPLPGSTASADVIEFEGEKTLKWIPPDTIEIEDGRQFRLCEVTP